MTGTVWQKTDPQMQTEIVNTHHNHPHTLHARPYESLWVESRIQEYYNIYCTLVGNQLNVFENVLFSQDYPKT